MLGTRGSVSLTRPSTSNNAFAGMTVTTARNKENMRNVMKNMSGKIVAWLNDVRAITCTGRAGGLTRCASYLS